MRTIDISCVKFADKMNWLQYAIAPRPIAFASTVDAAGNVNLSPFSFFNLFSYQPSIVVFSTVRRGRDEPHAICRRNDHCLERRGPIVNVRQASSRWTLDQFEQQSDPRNNTAAAVA